MINKTMYHGSDSFSGDEFNFDKPMWLISDPEEALQYGDKVFEVNVTLNNPYISSHQEKHRLGDTKLIEKAKRSGYDGIVLPPDNEMYELYIYDEAKFTVIIAFNKDQIKTIKPLTEGINVYVTFLESLKIHDPILINSVTTGFNYIWKKY